MLKICRRIQSLEKERLSELWRPPRFIIQLFAGNGKYAGSILYSPEKQERIFEEDVADHPDRNAPILASFAALGAERDKDAESLQHAEGQDMLENEFYDALPEWSEEGR